MTKKRTKRRPSMSLGKTEHKIPSRSEKYQHYYKEISVSDDDLKYEPDQRDLYNEKLLELRDQLHDRLWQLMQIHCTKNQFIIMDLYFRQHVNQSEIAKKLRISSQSTINKCMFGNVDYSKKSPRKFGGAIPKMKRICYRDPEIQKILKEIAEISE